MIFWWWCSFCGWDTHYLLFNCSKCGRGRDYPLKGGA